MSVVFVCAQRFSCDNNLINFGRLSRPMKKIEVDLSTILDMYLSVSKNIHLYIYIVTPLKKWVCMVYAPLFHQLLCICLFEQGT